MQRSNSVTIIEPAAGWKLFNLKELWQHRELLLQLGLRDISISYRQTLLGALWAIIPPVALMLVFTVIFGKVAKFPTPVPYPLFVFAGLVPWQFFAKSVGNASNSVLSAQQMIDKVYFPRLILPFSRLGGPLIDFALAIVILIGMMFYYGVVPGWRIILLPILSLLVIAAAVGIGSFLSALSVSFRDVRFIVPFVLQIAMFATPTFYMDTSDAKPPKHAVEKAASGPEAASLGKVATAEAREQKLSKPAAAVIPRGEGEVPDSIQNLLRFNPMAGLIGAFRSSLLNLPIAWDELGVAAVMILTCLVFGCLYFHRMEDGFADII